MNKSPGSWQWDDVRFFLAVARGGSLSGAARTLGVGHVTVGRRIAFLERRLGVTLLNRTPDGFVTTAAGDAVLHQCMAMETAALDLERTAAGRDSLITGSVRVTTTEMLAYQLVAPAAAFALSISPVATLILQSGSRNPLLRASSVASSERSAFHSTRRHGIWRDRGFPSAARAWPGTT
jgi:DNA-binding transcriptional LysR family regulator